MSISNLSELVLDFRLTTETASDCIVHVHRGQGPQREYWRRKSFIGGGAYGRVYLEECVHGKRNADLRAVKEIIKPTKSMPLTSLNRELEAFAKFSQPKFWDHFVRCYGWYETNETLNIALEYLEHGDLRTHLVESGPLSEEEGKEVVFQVLEGLEFMHSNKFAHRDIKPDNILIKRYPPAGRWWVKISDFGISKKLMEHDNALASRTLKGTLGFIPPELRGFTERGTDFATDIWALGEIAFQMLTAEASFNDALLFRYIHDPSVFPSSKLSGRDVSHTGIAFIQACLIPDPKHRLTAGGGLIHPWVAREPAEDIIPPPSTSFSMAGLDIAITDYGRWTTIANTINRPSYTSSLEEEFPSKVSEPPGSPILTTQQILARRRARALVDRQKLGNRESPLEGTGNRHPSSSPLKEESSSKASEPPAAAAFLVAAQAASFDRQKLSKRESPSERYKMPPSKDEPDYTGNGRGEGSSLGPEDALSPIPDSNRSRTKRLGDARLESLQMRRAMARNDTGMGQMEQSSDITAQKARREEGRKARGEHLGSESESEVV